MTGETGNWGVRGMRDDARRLALSRAASLGLSVAEYLASLIEADNAGVGMGQDVQAVNQKLEAMESHLGVVADLAARLGQLEGLVNVGMGKRLAKLEESAVQRVAPVAAQSTEAERIWQALGELDKHGTSSSWKTKAQYLNSQEIKTPRGEMWSEVGVRSWCRRNAQT